MKKRILVVLALTALVSACGYRGALYLPSEQPQTNDTPATEDNESGQKQSQRKLSGPL